MFGKKTITVLGAGNMGTALAQIIASNGYQVNIWNHDGDLEPLEQIAKFHENKKYLAGIKLSKNIFPEPNLAEALKKSTAVFFVLPSAHIGQLCDRVSKIIDKKAIAIDVSKGIDEETMTLIPDLMQKKLPRSVTILSLSGPAIAVDMVEGGFTAMNIAGKNNAAIKTVKKILENDHLRLKATTDVVGTEIAGSLKNVYAIAIGLADCYHWPMNTKAALFVSALKEISTLVKKMNGQEATVYDLAGLGDLIGTALSATSRNRRFGECLPKHTCKEEAAAAVGQVVEGIKTCKLAIKLSKKYHVKMPLAQAVYNIVWKKANAQKELNQILKSIS